MAGTNKVGIYDFSQVILLLRHQKYQSHINIDGFMKDSGITVDRSSEDWTMNNSGDNKATTMIYNPDKSGTIKFTLNQSTDSLDKMNAICDYTKRVRHPSILFETTLVDKTSRTIYFSPQSLASYPSSVGFETSEQGREFKIFCAELQEKIGGSSLVPLETQKILHAFGITVDDTWTIKS